MTTSQGVTRPHDELGPTLLLWCPVCGSDNAEPIGVVGNFEHNSPARVTLRCDTCSTIYLQPQPPTLPPTPPRPLRSRSISSWMRGFGAAAPSVSLRQQGHAVEGLAGSAVETLLFSLEASSEPVETVRTVAASLPPGGRLAVLGGNSASASFRLFGKRHWSGYVLPGTRQVLDPVAIRRLAEQSDLRLTDVRTLRHTATWIDSLRNLLQEWQMPRWLQRLLTGRWGGPQLLFGLVESVCTLAGRGALVAATLDKG